jgi:HEAT repeat protein
MSLKTAIKGFQLTTVISLFFTFLITTATYGSTDFDVVNALNEEYPELITEGGVDFNENGELEESEKLLIEIDFQWDVEEQEWIEISKYDYCTFLCNNEIYVDNTFYDNVVRSLILKLNDKDWKIRASAAEDLGKLRDHQSIPALIEASGDPQMGTIAVDALNYMGDVLLPVLIETLENHTFTWSLCRIFASRRDESIPMLVLELENDDPEVRADVVTILGELGNLENNVVRKFIEALKDPNPNVRLSIIKALKSNYSYSIYSGANVEVAPLFVMEALINATKDNDPTVRHAAIEGLLTIKTETEIRDTRTIPVLIELSNNDNLDSAIRARMVGFISDTKALNVTPYLFRVLRDRYNPIEMRFKAFNGLTTQEDLDVANVFVKAIKSEVEPMEVIKEAFRLLSGQEDSDTAVFIPTVAYYYNKSYEEPFDTIRRAIKPLYIDANIPSIIENKELPIETRIGALWSWHLLLKDVDSLDNTMLSFLIKRMLDIVEDEEEPASLRVAAIVSVTDTAFWRVYQEREYLRNQLNGTIISIIENQKEVNEIRTIITRTTYGRKYFQDFEEIMTDRLQDVSETQAVRLEAARYLIIGRRRCISEIAQDPQILDILIELLKDEQVVRDIIIWDLIQINNPKATAALVRTAEDKNEYTDIRNSGIRALGERATPEVINTLIQLLTDEAVSYWTAVTLVEIGEPALPALQEALDGETDELNVLLIQHIIDKISNKPIPATSPIKVKRAGKEICVGGLSWSNGDEYAFYHDFVRDEYGEPIDFSENQYLRLSNISAGRAEAAGAKILVRLLPKGSDPNSKDGLNPNIYIIPEDGVVIVPLSEFPQITDIVQISVHSGNKAWDIPLGQWERVWVNKIEVTII